MLSHILCFHKYLSSCITIKWAIHEGNPENKFTDKVAQNFRAMKQLGFSFTETFKKIEQVIFCGQEA